MFQLSRAVFCHVSRVKHVISNTSAWSSCNVSTFDWYPLFLVRIWSFILFNDKTRSRQHWTCNIQSIVSLFVCVCVCVSLCFYAWFADIPTGFKKSSQEIFRQVARSLAIGPTPGLGPSQRCSGGNNFSRTCPSQRKTRALKLKIREKWWGKKSHLKNVLPVPNI